MNKLELLSTVPLFLELDPTEIEKIASLLVERKYKKGSILFFEGDIGEEFFLIKKGVIKIYRIDNSKEIILSLFREGEFFGEMALVHKGDTRSATAEAIEDTELFTLSRTTFHRLLEDTPRLTLKLLEITVDRLRRANEQIEDLTFLDVRSRIFKTIAQLAQQYGKPAKEGTLIDIKLTHQLLANMVGTVRESVTKALLELQLEEVIHIEKKMIVLKKPLELNQKIMYL